MKTREPRDTAQDDLILAIGLIWGHLNSAQFDEADRLVRGCLLVWPSDERLVVMAAFAAVELGRPLDEATLHCLRGAKCRQWADLVLLRAVKAKELPC